MYNICHLEILQYLLYQGVWTPRLWTFVLMELDEVGLGKNINLSSNSPHGGIQRQQLIIFFQQLEQKIKNL